MPQIFFVAQVGKNWATDYHLMVEDSNQEAVLVAEEAARVVVVVVVEVLVVTEVAGLELDLPTAARGEC